MKKSLILVGMLSIGYAYAQEGNVGINTDNPRATLEITPSTPNLTGTTNEGIIAPNLSKTRIANIATPVEGTLVYATDATYAGTNAKVSKITEKGYYFYNGTEWVKVQHQDKGSRWINDTVNKLVKLDTYSNGTTVRSDLNNIRITDDGKFFLGREHNSTLESGAKLQVEGSVKATGLAAIASGNVGPAIRLYNTSKEANNQAHQWTIYNMTSTAADSGYKDALVFWNYNKNNITGDVTNQPKFFILDNGNVSVGGSPYIAGPDLTEKLTVHGTIKSTTLMGGAKKAVYATADGVLTIDNADAVDTNIYTSNGTLTGHRTVDMAGRNLLFTNNGRIGIGTTTPGSALTIEGTGGWNDDITINTFGDTTGAFALFTNKYRGTTENKAAVEAGDSLGVLNFRGYNGTAIANGVNISTVVSEVEGENIKANLIINPTKNVGIGNISPRARLDVFNSATNLDIPILALGTRNNTNNHVSKGIELYTDNSNFPAAIDVVRGASSGFTGLSFMTSQGVTDTRTEKMRIQPNGNVGIGTTAPDNKLHIKADANPLKLEGLQASTVASDKILVTDANGVVKTIEKSSLVSTPTSTDAVQVGSTNSMACNDANRGKMNFVKDVTIGSGTGDAFAVCLKGTDGKFYWRYLYGAAGVANSTENFGTGLQ